MLLSIFQDSGESTFRVPSGFAGRGRRLHRQAPEPTHWPAHDPACPFKVSVCWPVTLSIFFRLLSRTELVTLTSPSESVRCCVKTFDLAVPYLKFSPHPPSSTETFRIRRPDHLQPAPCNHLYIRFYAFLQPGNDPKLSSLKSCQYVCASLPATSVCLAMISELY